MKIFMYFNIPWNFIKQRPQFLAEKLKDYINIGIYYNKAYKSIYIVKELNEPIGLDIISKIKVPRKSKLLIEFDNFLQRNFLKNYLNPYAYIWIMHPDQYEILSPLLKEKKIIYDCMDDYSQFPHLSPQESMRLKKIEKDLIARADYIFYTSKTLSDNLKKRYPNQTASSYIINNALEPQENYRQDQEIYGYMKQIKTKKVVYIGAIAPWFDFDLINKLLEANKEISVVLFGPTDVSIPQLERLYHYGKIPHESIYTAMQEADVLIMPFKMNDLILAVDPIKVYEYIYSGKQVIVPYYPEMDKFKDYVSIYHDSEEAVEMINHLNKGNDAKGIEEFVRNNTWEARARQIAQILQIDEKKNTSN